MKYLREYRGYLIACNFTEATIKTKMYKLQRFAERIDRDIQFATVDDIIKYISEPGLKKVSLYNRYSVLKAFYQWLEDDDKIIINPMVKVPMPKLPKALPTKVMTKGEANKLLATISEYETNPYKFRDLVIMHVMYSCSLRRFELVGLDIDGFDRENLTLYVHPCKNKVARITPIAEKAAGLLDRYIKEFRGNYPEKAIFVNYAGKRLDKGYVTIMVRKQRKKSGIRTKATSHSFRKTSATITLKNGASIFAVSKLLNHSNISSTEIYTKLTPKDVFHMHRTYHPRERQKNIELPKLEIPKFMYGGDEMKGGRLEYDADILDVLKYHPREKDELPLLKIPEKLK